MKLLTATTEFSLGASLLSVEDIKNIVEENSIDRVFITDTMNVSALIPLSEKLGDKLAFGVRFNLVDELLDEKKLPVYQPKVYPLTERGMQTIYEFLSYSFEKPQFYFVPRLSFAQFESMLQRNKGDFVVTTGDFFNLFKHQEWKDKIERISKLTNLYAERIQIENAVFSKSNIIANSSGLRCISSRPVLYLKGDQDAFPIHYSINKNVEFNYLNPYNKDLYYKDILPTKEDLEFADLPFYKWSKQSPKLPVLSANPIETLKEEVFKGFKDKISKSVYGYKPSHKEVIELYIPRLKYEIEIIEKLGFASYFLMVWELTNWCQRNDILVGPGRGSAAGSLLSYCLGITDVDPIKAGLMFERFINPSRLDLPDIDLDIMSTRRDEVINHLYDRYGRENVSAIINYATLQSKSALRSTCRILGLPETEYACSKLIPSQFGFTTSLEEAKGKVVEIKQFADKHPDVWNIARKLESKLRNYGTHASGIIVSDRKINKDAVLEQRGTNRVINWDKKTCEKQGLIKLDVLGLTTLDIIDLCIKNIKNKHGVKINLNDIRLDDHNVLELFSKGYTGGIFQFEGSSVKRLLRDLSNSVDLVFDDLVAANALNRPGPIEAGLVTQYVEGKNGMPIDAWHSSIAHIVDNTYNIPCYQEQIMQISVDLAGYTLPEADNLRKIMGKKLPDEMKKEKTKFIDGCISKGVDPKIADEIFTKIEGFAMYAFNKSHSYAYSMLAYICMWLKFYYSVEFYAASLTYIADDKVSSIITEASKFDIKVLPPDILYSTDKFKAIDDKVIVAPLTKIKYLSTAAAFNIMTVRNAKQFTDYDDLVNRTETRFVNSRVLRALDAVGSLDSLMGRMKASVDPVERSRAIYEYLPSLPLGYVAIDRRMEITSSKYTELAELQVELKIKNPTFTKPFLGKTPKFMVIFDNATATEGKNGQFTMSKGFSTIEAVCYRNGLTKADGYWTGLVKRTKNKGETVFSNEVLEESYKDLQKEIDILRPPVVLVMGTNAVKFFNPELKGSAFDAAGKVIYNKEYDMNVILGFNPSSIFFDPEKEVILENLVEMVSNMVLE